MLFDTPIYFVFLVPVVVLYWRLNRRRQNLFLVAASYIFYGWWDYRFLALILISSIVDFHCARFIARSASDRRRKALVCVSLAVNLSFLGFFKYFNFFVDSMVDVLGALGIHGVHVTTLRILLPPGISFYTFQEIAYIVDVYRRKLEPTDSFVDYALFISLFPHLIAGPIQQPSHLLPQIQKPRALDARKFFDGLMLIISGIFRKCVIADNCALLAQAAFDGRLGEPSLGVLVIGTYAFALQIYGDFSGYSDIARGSAQLLGFHFMVNFRQPYLASTLSEFWRRWHISLSTWLRDYLFLPVSYWLSRRWDGVRWLGLKDDLWIYAGATLATMLLAGLWHGANWTFVVWGGLFGLFMGLERVVWTLAGPKGRKNPLRSTQFRPASIGNWILCALLFNFVCLTWVFFRSQSLGQATTMFAGIGNLAWQPAFGGAFRLLAAVAVPMLLIDLVNEVRGEEYLLERGGLHHRLAAGFAMITIAALFSANSLNAFVYFQF